MSARLSPAGKQTEGAAPAPAANLEFEDVAAPIRAGMRARAIADACERMDLPVVMIDGAARVLHVAASVSPMLDGAFAVAAGHLIGRTAETNRRIERAITAALGGGEGAGDVEDAAAGEDGLLVAGLPVRDPSVYQIMRGLIVLARPDERTPARLDTLRALLG